MSCNNEHGASSCRPLVWRVLATLNHAASPQTTLRLLLPVPLAAQAFLVLSAPRRRWCRRLAIL